MPNMNDTWHNPDNDEIVCDHCHAAQPEVIDYRGADVISKYRLCGTCAAMTDEEFFRIGDQTLAAQTTSSWIHPGKKCSLS